MDKFQRKAPVVDVASDGKCVTELQLNTPEPPYTLDDTEPPYTLDDTEPPYTLDDTETLSPLWFAGLYTSMTGGSMDNIRTSTNVGGVLPFNMIEPDEIDLPPKIGEPIPITLLPAHVL